MVAVPLNNTHTLKPAHLAEWRDQSAVDEAIVRLNVHSLSDSKIIAEKLNWKAWKNGAGFWIGGIDPQTGMRTLLGGQFKPDEPIPNGAKQDGTPRFRKYVGRKGEDQAQPLFLQMPDRDYWKHVLEDASIPIVITEGGKKAGAGLTAGYATISLPGVACGQKCDRLKEKLKLFCGFGRKVYLAFDADLLTNPNVFRALKQLASLISAEGATVHITLWDGGENGETKGMDDLIAKLGKDAFTHAIASAPSFAEWYKEKHSSGDYSRKEKLSFYQQILRDLYEQPGDQWVCIDGSLYQWTSTYYKKSYDEDEIRRIYHYCNTYELVEGDYITYPYASPGYMTKALIWIKAALSRPPEIVDPPGINCTNGVLEIRWKAGKPIWELIPHSPDRIYTYEPVVQYNPSADSTHCDRLLEALEPLQRDIFLKTIAASLDLTEVRKHKGRMIRALLLKGDGANGKDTLREVLSAIYGRKGLTGCTFNDFMQYDQGRKFPLSKLQNSRVNWSSENSTIAQLDKLQSMKQSITGEDLDFEGKGKDERTGAVKSVFLFNCNETPNMQASMEAIKSRFGVISFNKTFKIGADPRKGEIEADARFKYDPQFLQEQVLPAFLNRLLQALVDLMEAGIDYSATYDAMEAIQTENNHLYQFCKDVGLWYDPNGAVYVKDIWDKLESWYIDNGTIQIDPNGKRTWIDQVKPRDKNVKGINQVLPRLLELFPKAKRESRDGKGVIISGLSFDSFDRQNVASTTESVAVCTSSEAVCTSESLDTPQLVADRPNLECEEKIMIFDDFSPGISQSAITRTKVPSPEASHDTTNQPSSDNLPLLPIDQARNNGIACDTSSNTSLQKNSAEKNGSKQSNCHKLNNDKAFTHANCHESGFEDAQTATQTVNSDTQNRSSDGSDYEDENLGNVPVFVFNEDEWEDF